MNIRSYGGSFMGRRLNNEDALGKREPADPGLRAARGCLYIAADGMGGHAAGEIASRLAVETILSEYYADQRSPEESLVAAIREASRRIYHVAGDSVETDGMGCTVVACAILRGSATIAHVGDSRAYRLHGSEFARLTEDHCADDHEGIHILSRAVGVRPDVKVSVTVWPLEPGDRLLLCTDGLSNAVPEADLTEGLRQSGPVEAIEKLIGCAKDRQANDNASAIVVEWLEPSGATSEPLATEPPIQEAPVVDAAAADTAGTQPLARSAAARKRGMLGRLFGNGRR